MAVADFAPTVGQPKGDKIKMMQRDKAIISQPM
jgi:hypothetical protein